MIVMFSSVLDVDLRTMRRNHPQSGGTDLLTRPRGDC
jgi:hypothetical protein